MLLRDNGQTNTESHENRISKSHLPKQDEEPGSTPVCIDNHSSISLGVHQNDASYELYHCVVCGWKMHRLLLPLLLLL